MKALWASSGHSFILGSMQQEIPIRYDVYGSSLSLFPFSYDRSTKDDVWRGWLKQGFKHGPFLGGTIVTYTSHEIVHFFITTFNKHTNSSNYYDPIH